MLGMAPDYDHLPLINKVEVFQHALDSTSGDALLLHPAYFTACLASLTSVLFSFLISFCWTDMPS